MPSMNLAVPVLVCRLVGPSTRTPPRLWLIRALPACLFALLVFVPPIDAAHMLRVAFEIQHRAVDLGYIGNDLSLISRPCPSLGSISAFLWHIFPTSAMVAPCRCVHAFRNPALQSACGKDAFRTKPLYGMRGQADFTALVLS